MSSAENQLPKNQHAPLPASPVTAKATFAAGCFWGVEHSFRQLPGVVEAISGYIGGVKNEPTYREVCSGATGHAEAVEVEYRPQEIAYRDLLEHFWAVHDPTTLNRQGPDIGSQYRSGIFFHSPEQAEDARTSLDHAQQRLLRPIVTEITPATTFWPAEEYHQRYFEKHGLRGCGL